MYLAFRKVETPRCITTFNAVQLENWKIGHDRNGREPVMAFIQPFYRLTPGTMLPTVSSPLAGL